MDTDVGCFHWVVGDSSGVVGQIFCLGICSPLGYKLSVHWILDRLEVVPGSQVAHERLGIDTTQLFFTNRESNNGYIRRLQAGIAELFVERHV